MEDINKRQKQINDNLMTHYTFNAQHVTPMFNEAPLDTLNDKKIHVDTRKCSGNECNPMVENRLRTTYKLNENSDLYSLNKSLATKQHTHFDLYKSIHTRNQQSHIEVEEKLVFNNHTRLT